MAAQERFSQILKERGVTITRGPMQILQINVGKLCNQVCHHCHVEAGPKRTEIMEAKTADRIMELLETAKHIHTIDLTGGAPEMNPHFRRLTQFGRSRGMKVIDRCNLTVFFENGQKDLPQFLADNGITVVASLPCYSQKNVDAQRGQGVFKKSIDALKMLNSLGYGKAQSGKELHLVYNPVGAFLPPPQEVLQAEYKAKLMDDFGISFNQLFTITNMPIKRFLQDLKRQKKLDDYMQLLIQQFNPSAAASVMCRDLVSVGWDGQIYDCDFNQMLEMPVAGKKQTIWDIESFSSLENGTIAFDSHCFGCTAGSGSSCGGSLT